MSRSGAMKRAVLAGVILLLAAGGGSAAASGDLSGELSGERASWLMSRESLLDLAATGHQFEQAEVGGGGGGEMALPDDGRRSKGALPVLASLVLPGSGEAMLGYKRGYLMMAVDLFAWSQVISNHNDGKDMREAYYAFADAHYSDERLVLGYTNNAPISGDELEDWYARNAPTSGQLGNFYFANLGTIDTVSDLEKLPLYVTKEDDFREYYENLGKWNQFVFGWDDFVSPYDLAGYDATGNQLEDLAQPGVSQNRETYRLMRDESNESFKTRDRWLYVNIGMRIFSVLQTAYLQGLLGGGPAEELKVSGHTIQFHAQPMGLRHGAMAASVSF